MLVFLGAHDSNIVCASGGPSVTGQDHADTTGQAGGSASSEASTDHEAILRVTLSAEV